MENKEKRESFVMYNSFIEAGLILSAEDFKNYILKLRDYAIYGDTTKSENEIINSLLILAMPNINAASERYDRCVENGMKGKEYGKLGGRPRKGETKEQAKERRSEKPQENPQITPSTETPRKPQEGDIESKISETPRKPQEGDIESKISETPRKPQEGDIESKISETPRKPLNVNNNITSNKNIKERNNKLIYIINNIYNNTRLDNILENKENIFDNYLDISNNYLDNYSGEILNILKEVISGEEDRQVRGISKFRETVKESGISITKENKDKFLQDIFSYASKVLKGEGQGEISRSSITSAPEEKADSQPNPQVAAAPLPFNSDSAPFCSEPYKQRVMAEYFKQRSIGTSFSGFCTSNYDSALNLCNENGWGLNDMETMWNYMYSERR